MSGEYQSLRDPKKVIKVRHKNRFKQFFGKLFNINIGVEK